MKRHLNYLQRAQNLAEMSELQTKHGAIIVSSGVVLAEGINKKEAPRKKLMSNYTSCNYGQSVHAEYDCIYDLLINIRYGTSNVNIRRMKVDIYISRNSLEQSKPCHHCINLLKYIGIYRVFYTTGDDNFEIEKIINYK